MRRQRNISQVKEQAQTTARDQSKMDIKKIPERKFKIVITKIHTGLEKRVEARTQ